MEDKVYEARAGVRSAIGEAWDCAGGGGEQCLNQLVK